MIKTYTTEQGDRLSVDPENISGLYTGASFLYITCKHGGFISMSHPDNESRDKMYDEILKDWKEARKSD